MVAFYYAYAGHHWASVGDIQWDMPFTNQDDARTYAFSMLCDDDSVSVFKAEINLEQGTIKVTNVYYPEITETLQISDVPKLRMP